MFEPTREMYRQFMDGLSTDGQRKATRSFLGAFLLLVAGSVALALASYWEMIAVLAVIMFICSVICAILGLFFLWPWYKQQLDEAMAERKQNENNKK